MCLNKWIDDVVRLGFVMCMLKYTIIFLNGLFIIAGLALVGFGTFINIPAFIVLSKNYLGSISVNVGAATTFLSCCGFLSAVFGKIYGLVIYLIMLFFVLAAEAAAVTIFFSSESQTRTILHTVWTSLAEKNRENIQNKLSCCGWYEVIPGDTCPATSTNTCWEKLLSVMKDDNQITFKVLIGIVIVELVLFTWTVLLARKLLKVTPVTEGVKYATTPSSPDAVRHSDTLIAPENAYTNFCRSPFRML